MTELVRPVVVATAACSPAAKSLKPVKPVPMIEVALGVVAAGEVHAPLYFWRMKFSGLAPPTTSLATKLNVAL